MVEDIGKIIGNGFETYTKNLNLTVPFILNIFISGLLGVIMVFSGFLSIFAPVMSSLENAAPEKAASIFIPYLEQHMLEVVLWIVIIFLVMMLVEAFFTAGAIGMAGQATETGRCELSTMMEAGKKNVMNLFLAEVLVVLLYIAGVIFMVPGAVSIDPAELLSPENNGAVVLLAAGFLLFVVYLIILTLVLGVFRYALVLDGLDPVESIAASYTFFKKHRVDVILLFLVVFAIGAVLFVIDQIMGIIPIINAIWFFVSLSISLFILPPLTTVWWVRLYMTRTDRKIYFNELLAHPDDLETLK